MASKNYIQNETAKVWTDATTGGDELLDLGGLTDGAGAVGSYLDLGAASRSDVYQIEVFIDGFDSAPTVGRTVDIFFTQSEDTTIWDGPPSTPPGNGTQGALGTIVALRNMYYAGSVTVLTVTPGDNLVSRFTIRLTSRYVAPVVYNRSGGTLLSTSDAHKITLRAIPLESQ